MKKNFKILLGTLLVSNWFLFTMPALAQVEENQIQTTPSTSQEIQVTDNIKVTPYGGFKFKKELKLKKSDESDFLDGSSVSMTGSFYVGMKSQFEIDFLDNPLNSDIKGGIKFSDIAKKNLPSVFLSKAYIKSSQLKLGADETTFAGEDVVLQFVWNPKFGESGFENILALESSDSKHLFFRTVKPADDEIKDSYKRMKDSSVKYKGWLPMAIAEKIKFSNDNVEVSFGGLVKPILYQQPGGSEEGSGKLEFAVGGGTTFDLTWNAVKDWTEFNFGVVGGYGIGNYVGDNIKDLEEDNDVLTEGGKLSLLTAAKAYIGMTQFIVPSRLAFELGYSYEVGGADVKEMMTWEGKFHTVEANLVWDISQVEKRFRWKVGVESPCEMNNPVNLTSTISMSLV